MTKKELKQYKREWERKNKKKLKTQHRQYQLEHKEELKIYWRKYRLTHKKEKQRYNKKYRTTHKIEIKKHLQKYHQIHKNKINLQHRKYYQKNKEQVLQRQKNYYKLNREKILNRQNEYRKIRRKTDINFKIVNNLRGRIYAVLKRNRKSKHTLELLGCSIKQLKQHLEKQFVRGMSWSNYGYRGWHIDHIKPCCKFNLRKKSEQLKCFNYTNLQPLWAKENLKKHNKINGELIGRN